MSTDEPGAVRADDAAEVRAALLEGWERSAEGWGKRAARVRDWGMPVSAWMIDRLALQPGQRVLELAAGPGDTGFLAAELIAPGGTLVSSDAAEAMVELARHRAAELGIDNAEFRRLELEWIDLPTADVDAILCRWGVMLSVDPEAALRESRRVLRPRGRIALAVWDEEGANPWATIPMRALAEHGHAPPPGPAGPGMFSLAAPGQLAALLEATGFLDVLIDAVALERAYADAAAFVEETLDLSRMFRERLAGLPADDVLGVRRTIDRLLEGFTGADGSVRLPGRSLVAAANA